MVKVCINGGSIAGLSTALLLAKDGHDVTVVERDAAPPHRDPRRSWGDWDHRSVRQLRQTHALLPRFRKILVEELPHVWTRLLEAGVLEHGLASHLPETIADRSARPIDDELVLLLGRRTTVDTVLHHAAADDPRIEVLAGVAAKGIEVAATPGGGLRVTGVATSAGTVEANVIVDCGGARTAVPDWVEEAGGTRPTELIDEFRISYWTQWFRPRPGMSAPELRDLPAVNAGPFTVLRCGADDGWWSTTLVAPADDRRFRVLSDQDALLRTLAALPPTSEWVDPVRAEPVGGIKPMFIPFDGRRRYVVDGRPSIAGLTAVGDAVGATNPTLGRGATFALMHGAGLRDVLRTSEEPERITTDHHEHLEGEFQPWWQQTVDSDRNTLARMRALAAGEEPPPPDPGLTFRHAAHHDPELFRGLLEVAGVLTPVETVLGRPGALERMGEVLDRVGPPTPLDVDLDVLLGSAPEDAVGPPGAPRTAT